MNQKNKPEEVDLLQFFTAVGQMFHNLFAAIKGLILKIFYLSIDILLYFKKHYKWLAGGLLVGLLISFLIPDNGKKNVFVAKSLLRTNYDAQAALLSKVKMFNTMIAEKSFDKLAKELNLTEEEAKSLKKFKLEPVINDVLLIPDYENYLSVQDTVVYKFIEFDKYKKNMSKNLLLNQYWELTVRATQQDIFGKLNESLIHLTDADENVKIKKQNYLAYIKTTKEKLLKSLAEIDSMRNVYNKVLLETAKNATGGATNIVVSADKVRGVEHPYDLFYERGKIYERLNNITALENRYFDAIIMLNDFPKYGIKDEGLLSNKHIKYTLLGFILVLLFLLLIDFNAYLKAYEKQKSIRS
jgi:hypothetical protein